MKTSRTTIARTTIYDLIKKSDNALSHTDIQKVVGDLCNRVTIYRILDRLIEEGEIHKIVNIDGVIKYAACTHHCESHAPHHHHNHIHFSCVQCQSVTCLENVEPVFKIPANYIVQEVHFTLSGLCPDCSKK